MRTSDSITQAVRDASDILDVIGQYVSLKRAGQSYRGLCPLHQEKTPSFHVRADEGYFKCFGCGKGGDVFTFLMEYHGVSFPEALQILADRAGIEVPRSGSRQRESTPRGQILELNRWAADLYRQTLQGPLGKQARDYLASRQISEECAETFQLGFAPDSFDFLIGRAQNTGISADSLISAGLAKARQNGGAYDAFRGRLMFPIVDPLSRVLGFGGRTLAGDALKYINSPETPVFNKSRCLYGLHLAKKALEEAGQAILVEGYTDVLMAHQHGFCNAVATLGTSMTQQHAGILKRYVPKVVLVFDSDPAGSRAAERGIEIAIQSQLDVFLAQLPPAADPCSFLTSHPKSEFEELLNSAPSALEFKWSAMQAQYGAASSSTATRSAVESFVSFVGTLVTWGQLDAIQRGLILNQLAKLLGVSREEIHRLLLTAERQAKGAARGLKRPHEPLPQAGSGAAESARASAEQAALVDVLRVLLCCPGMYLEVGELLEPDLIADPQDQRIARTALALAQERDEESSTSALLSRFDRPDDGARVLALIEESRCAGQFEARLAAASQRLDAMRCARLAQRVGQEVATPSSVAECGEERDRKLAELHRWTQDYSNFSNFAGIRKLTTRRG